MSELKQGIEEFRQGLSAELHVFEPPHSDKIDAAFSDLKGLLAEVLHEQILLRWMMSAALAGMLGVLVLAVRLHFVMPR